MSEFRDVRQIDGEWLGTNMQRTELLSVQLQNLHVM